MATYFVAASGSNTSPYDTWAKAATSLQTALSAATGNNDAVVIQYDAVPSVDAELSANTTYTFAGNAWLISASNDGGSAYTPTAMGGANWIGNSTTSRHINFVANDWRCRLWGLTIRCSQASGATITIAAASASNVCAENCYFWNETTYSFNRLSLASTTDSFALLKDCTMRFGNTAQGIQFSGRVVMDGCSIDAAGSVPSTLFVQVQNEGSVQCIGCDFSLVTGTLVPNSAQSATLSFDRCKLGAGVTVLAAQLSNPNRVSPQVWLSDCASGDVHMTMGYYDGLGSCTSDTGIYTTAGAAQQAWKVVTTANVGTRQPFETPWIDLYHSGAAAITPYIEIARDGSTTAYRDDEVWAEFSAKTTAGSTLATSYSDVASLANLIALGGSNQAAGAGTGAWTGLSGTAWSGKCDSGGSLTPAEIGALRARICVAKQSTTVYVDPQIRT